MNTETTKRRPRKEWPHSEEMTAALADRYFQLLQRRYRPDGTLIQTLAKVMEAEPPIGRHFLAYLSCAYYIAKHAGGQQDIKAIHASLLRLLDKQDTPEDRRLLEPMNRGMRLLGRLVRKGCQRRAEAA